MTIRPSRAQQTIDGLIQQSGRTQDDVMRAEVAVYVTEMCAELAKMSRASGLPLLSYFLEMAMAEGRAEAKKLDVQP